MNKKHQLFLLMLLSLVIFSCSNKLLYVKYGKAQQRFADSSASDGVIRIMLDRFGTIYPGNDISDDLIKRHYSVLENVYSYHKDVFENALRANQLPPGSTIRELQVKLIDKYVEQINKGSEGKKLVFIIHGYNKHPFKPSDASSYLENLVMRKKILENYSSEKFQFVEIYWDGLSWANSVSALSPFNSIKVWNNAQPASTNVGLEVRRIMSGLKAPTTYIITHSLGASVATTALFNVDKYNPSNFRQGYLNQFNDTVNYRTPTGKFRLGLLAPAIPGMETFDDFYARTPLVSSNPDNYSVLIGFNKNDRVLRKFKVVKPKHIGSTTLGCDEAELVSSRQLVNVNGLELFDVVHFSLKANSQKQKTHAFHKYVQNETAMNTFLKKLFEN